MYQLLVLLLLALNASSFQPLSIKTFARPSCPCSTPRSLPPLFAKLYKDRRDELGLRDQDDEYDPDYALDVGTDPFITKVIAGSFIVALQALLVVGIVQPALFPVEGECNPLLSGGGCPS